MFNDVFIFELCDGYNKTPVRGKKSKFLDSKTRKLSSILILLKDPRLKEISQFCTLKETFSEFPTLI